MSTPVLVGTASIRHGVMQPRVLQLRRLVIGEATRFPALGHAFYDAGLGRMDEGLATTFAQLADDGRLRVPDTRLTDGQG